MDAREAAIACLDEAAVLEYPSGEAGTDGAIDAHLADCAACRMLVRLATSRSESGADAVDPDEHGTSTTENAPTIAHASALTRPRPTSPLAEGDRIGRYRIERPLGAGGMGVVYAAYDPQLDRQVAVKLLHRPTSTRTSSQLVQEGRAIARLAHPNVVTVYDLGEDDGQWYVAMELVVGGTLHDWLQARPRSPLQIVAMFIAAGRGLAAAHAAGLVHRDVKPTNVLVGEDERPRVSDFGLAVTDHEAATTGEVGGGGGGTGGGATPGTPAYMAPEQIDGGTVDARADQFSFAVALFEALDGRRPFTGSDPRSIRASIAAGPRALRVRVPRGLGAALHRALSEAPADRFPSLELLLRALTPPHRRRWRWAALGTTLIAGGVAVSLITRGLAATSCTDLDRGLVGIWDPGRREAVRRAFEGSGLAGAAEAAQLVSAGLDRYVASLTAARVDTCEAAQVRREQTPAQQELRTVCLDERLAELRAVSDLLVAPDREIVTNAHALLASLTPPSACADLAALSERLPVAGAHHQVAKIRGLRSGLARVRAVVAAGQVEAAAGDLARLRPEIERTGYRPLQAEAALIAGQIAGKQGYLAEADAQVRAAVLAAEAGRDHRTAAAAWLFLVQIRGHSGDLAGAHDALAHATATVERLGIDLDASADLAHARGTTLRNAGRYAEARAALEEAVRLLERSRVDRRVHTARVQLELAAVIISLGDHDLATRTSERAIAQLRQTLGPLHPELANGLVTAAATSLSLLDLAATRVALDEAERILYASVGDAHPIFAMLLSMRAQLRYLEGEYPDALVLLGRSRDLFHQRFGEGYTYLASLHRQIATAAIAIGDTGRARTEIARAADLYERAGGADSIEVLQTRSLEPWLALAEGDPAAAETSARRNLATYQRVLGSAHPTTAEAARSLGAMLVHRDRLVDASLAYEEALASLRRAGAGGLRGARYAFELGDIYVSLERFDEAIAVLRAAVEIEIAQRGERTADARDARALLAEAYRGLGQPARSVEILEVLVAELAADPAAAATPELARAQLWLGIGLAETGGSRERARALVAGARSALRGSDPDAARIAATWLRSHPRR